MYSCNCVPSYSINKIVLKQSTVTLSQKKKILGDSIIITNTRQTVYINESVPRFQKFCGLVYITFECLTLNHLYSMNIFLNYFLPARSVGKYSTSPTTTAPAGKMTTTTPTATTNDDNDAGLVGRPFFSYHEMC
jgi:hypothetical protein